MASATERTMTNTSPTALEEIRKRNQQAKDDIQNNFGAAYSSRITQDKYSIHEDRDKALTHIAALEAELADAVRARDEWETQSENQCRDRERYRDVLVLLCAAPPEITRKAMASVAYDTVFNLIPKDVAEFQLVERSKAEAQLATRLPTREEIARVQAGFVGWDFDLLSHNDDGPGGRQRYLKRADAILALLSGAATPAPTAAHLRRFREQTEAEVFGYVTGVEDAAALYESVNPASDDERIKGSPGAGAMGAVIEYRDKIRELLHAKSPPQGAEE